MAYSVQSFTVGQVATAAAWNQTETNIRDHAHGSLGVSGGNIMTRIDEVSSRNTSVISMTADTGTTLTSIVLSGTLPGDRINVNAFAGVTRGTTAAGPISITIQNSGAANVLYYDSKTSVTNLISNVASGGEIDKSISLVGKVNSGGNAVISLRSTVNGAAGSVSAGEAQIHATLFRIV